MTIDLSDVSFDGHGRISAVLDRRMPFGAVSKCEVDKDGFGLYAGDTGLSSLFAEDLQVGEFASRVKVNGFQLNDSA